MKLVFASDHAGFALKQDLIGFTQSLGYETQDLGPHQLTPDDDYPDFVSLVANSVSRSPNELRGIVIGGSGQGEAMVANRYKGVRAAVYYGGSIDVIRLSREHNDANVLSLGARLLAPLQAREALKLWLSTPFSGEERHIRRIAKFNG